MTKSQHLQIRLTPEQKAALKRQALRAGTDVSTFVLARALPPAASRFAELLRALGREDEPQFVLAEFNDLLTGLAPAELRVVLADGDLRGLSPYLQNYVAAMVEQAAYRNRVAPPAWVNDVEPLTEPRFATSLPGLRLHLLSAAPVPFRRRNVFVDSALGDRV